LSEKFVNERTRRDHQHAAVMLAEPSSDPAVLHDGGFHAKRQEAQHGSYVAILSQYVYRKINALSNR
jgi:hypothetical protein